MQPGAHCLGCSLQPRHGHTVPWRQTLHLSSPSFFEASSLGRSHFHKPAWKGVQRMSQGSWSKKPLPCFISHVLCSLWPTLRALGQRLQDCADPIGGLKDNLSCTAWQKAQSSQRQRVPGPLGRKDEAPGQLPLLTRGRKHLRHRRMWSWKSHDSCWDMATFI